MRIAATILALATAGATLSLGTAPAFAEENRQAVVQYQDLNLGSAAGRSALDGRIKSAARQVCGAVPIASLQEVQSVRSCHRATRSDAWDQITATATAGQIRAAR